MIFERGRPTSRKPPFKFSAFTRVDFSDTDAQGIVYYGRYLPYFDLARVEYLRSLGLLARTAGDPEFVMRASSVEYFAPAGFDDPIEIFARHSRLGSTSATWEFAAHSRDDLLMVTAQQVLVLVDLTERRPTPIPASYRDLVLDLEGVDCATGPAA